MLSNKPSQRPHCVPDTLAMCFKSNLKISSSVNNRRTPRSILYSSPLGSEIDSYRAAFGASKLDFGDWAVLHEKVKEGWCTLSERYKGYPSSPMGKYVDGKSVSQSEFQGRQGYIEKHVSNTHSKITTKPRLVPSSKGLTKVGVLQRLCRDQGEERGPTES